MKILYLVMVGLVGLTGTVFVFLNMWRWLRQHQLLVNRNGSRLRWSEEVKESVEFHEMRRSRRVCILWFLALLVLVNGVLPLIKPWFV